MAKEIIILEDDMDIREICTYLFSSEGYNVNSYSTVSSFSSNQTLPDLYLLDIRLPDGNGLEVCKRLKADPMSANIPIIMMSAHMDVALADENCDAEAFIPKPFRLDDLINCADRLAGR